MRTDHCLLSLSLSVSLSLSPWISTSLGNSKLAVLPLPDTSQGPLCSHEPFIAQTCAASPALVPDTVVGLENVGEFFSSEGYAASSTSQFSYLMHVTRSGRTGCVSQEGSAVCLS